MLLGEELRAGCSTTRHFVVFMSGRLPRLRLWLESSRQNLESLGVENGDFSFLDRRFGRLGICTRHGISAHRS